MSSSIPAGTTVAGTAAVGTAPVVAAGGIAGGVAAAAYAAGATGRHALPDCTIALRLSQRPQQLSVQRQLFNRVDRIEVHSVSNVTHRWGRSFL